MVGNPTRAPGEIVWARFGKGRSPWPAIVLPRQAQDSADPSILPVFVFGLNTRRVTFYGSTVPFDAASASAVQAPERSGKEFKGGVKAAISAAKLKHPDAPGLSEETIGNIIAPFGAKLVDADAPVLRNPILSTPPNLPAPNKRPLAASGLYQPYCPPLKRTAPIEAAAPAVPATVDVALQQLRHAHTMLKVMGEYLYGVLGCPDDAVIRQRLILTATIEYTEDLLRTLVLTDHPFSAPADLDLEMRTKALHLLMRLDAEIVEMAKHIPSTHRE